MTTDSFITTDFIESVRNKEFLHTSYAVEYNLYDFIKYADSHPTKKKTWADDKKRLLLTAMELRDSTPQFAKDILTELQSLFTKNGTSAHSFVGFTSDSESFAIHKDRMDVLYLQVIGEIYWSVWKSDSEDDNISPEMGTCIWRKKFTPGDMIWIPRGTYHLVEPITTRVGFSFGVEGDIDPCEYVNGN